MLLISFSVAPTRGLNIRIDQGIPGIYPDLRYFYYSPVIPSLIACCVRVWLSCCRVGRRLILRVLLTNCVVLIIWFGQSRILL